MSVPEDMCSYLARFWAQLIRSNFHLAGSLYQMYSDCTHLWVSYNLYHAAECKNVAHQYCKMPN